MSQTLLRFGLWIVLLALALYVVRETFSDTAQAEYLNDEILQKAVTFGLFLLGSSVVANILEKVFTKASSKLRHCAMCRQNVSKGEIYCRTHLRMILERENEMNRRTRTR